MPYDFFPKTVTELRSKTKSHAPETKGELYVLFKYLKDKYPKIDAPINLDLSKKNSVNISRALQEDTTIKKIESATKLKTVKMKFGNGSSGNRGVNNRGNLFEPEFADALLKWWQGERVSDAKMLKAIEDLDKTYNLKKSKKLKIDVVGGENTKRPLIYSPRIKLANPKGSGYNIGKSVTDITLHTDTQEIYLSLKLGTTVTFFNVGVRTVLSPDDIKSYNITGDGLKLLKAFKIDPDLFCDVFNGKIKRRISPVTVRPKNLDELLKTGIGEGYHIIHKLSGQIKSKKMDRKALNTASKITTATIYYGGKTGTGRRIDYEVESPTYAFKLNIRDTQGKDGYPTRLMCDFKYK
jgi:hypothetical protein